jgi:8-oxo-dGTP diphosphatase
MAFQPLRFLKAVLKVIFRHPIVGVTMIPILPDGGIVLIRRRDTGQWGLPGGIVDWGEDIPTAACRELAEETGLKLLEISRLLGVYSSFDRDPRIHSIAVAIEVKVQGEFKVQDTGEIVEARAFAPEELPLGNLSHDHDRQLQDYRQGLTTVA